MRRCLFFLVLLGVTVWARPVFAYADCPAYQIPEVELVRVLDPPRYNHAVPLQGIAALSAKAHTNSPNQMPVGVTVATQRLDTKMSMQIFTLPNGMVCAQIQKLTLYFGFGDTTVYVAAEIPEGSCGYHEVLQHEMKHVAVDRQIVNAYLPELGRRLPAFIDSIGMMRDVSQESASQKLNAIVERYMSQLNTTMETVHNNRQAVIDTPEEYSRLTYACGGDVGRLLGRMR